LQAPLRPAALDGQGASPPAVAVGCLLRHFPLYTHTPPCVTRQPYTVRILRSRVPTWETPDSPAVASPHAPFTICCEERVFTALAFYTGWAGAPRWTGLALRPVCMWGLAPHACRAPTSLACRTLTTHDALATGSGGLRAVFTEFALVASPAQAHVC